MLDHPTYLEKSLCEGNDSFDAFRLALTTVESQENSDLARLKVSSGVYAQSTYSSGRYRRL
jgi:hypothetical protein